MGERVLFGPVEKGKVRVSQQPTLIRKGRDQTVNTECSYGREEKRVVGGFSINCRARKGRTTEGSLSEKIMGEKDKGKKRATPS